jgi:hypothetical protein
MNDKKDINNNLFNILEESKDILKNFNDINFNEIKKKNNDNNIVNDNLNISPKKFSIKKNQIIYNPTTNYFQEYWKIFYDNEYLLAQIKENTFEINSMKAHIEELSKNEK